MQRKLTAIQVNEVEDALDSLENTIELLSETVIGVGSRMYKLQTHLRNVCEHGTTDGKPWVEPEPTIPEGYRLANADEYTRTDVKFWSNFAQCWEFRVSQGCRFDPPASGTRYIVPVDQELTDQDACQWPRLLVMVRDRDSSPWQGPKYLIEVCWTEQFRYRTRSTTGIDALYHQCRRATPQEVQQACLDRLDNPAKVEPCRGHDQQRAQ